MGSGQEALDIPDELFEKAKANYEDVGDWLSAQDSELNPFSPDVYVQGSFRLGTVIRPVAEDGEYDIDLVCNLNLTKEQTTQEKLKSRVGDRLKARTDLKKMLEESRRCWTLDYPGQFHMDVLPAIPNPDRPPTGLQLTDLDLRNWQKSNPKAYGDWFFGRMTQARIQRRSKVAMAMDIAIEDVPEWKVRTPLQRIVQLLKRHRDIHFSDAPKEKPASIIITTLVAMAYTDQTSLIEAITDVIPKMSMFIEKRGDRWWLQNPVDPEENFADKWNDHPEPKQAFDLWVLKAAHDLISLPSQLPLRDTTMRLASVMGSNLMAKVSLSLGLGNPASPTQIASPTLPVAKLIPSWVPSNEDTSHVQPPKWRMANRYHVEVEASLHSNREGNFLGRLKGMLVPRQHWLKFVAKTNAPKPFSIEWQVANIGQEARNARQLRGDFYQSDPQDGTVRWESTAYLGDHWVEAFVIQNGVCVARSGPVAVPVGPERGVQQFRSVVK